MTTEPADTLKEYRLMAARDAEADGGEDVAGGDADPRHIGGELTDELVDRVGDPGWTHWRCSLWREHDIVSLYETQAICVILG